tara:strand:+ start:2504 stop:3676 length:1173 start_codon:yes stop_codon:yes gene_type:complete
MAGDEKDKFKKGDKFYDTDFFWNSKYKANRTGKHGYISNYVDGSDALANAGFVVSFYHIPSGKSVFFKAFITTFSENFTSDWKPAPVFGRTDPVYSFGNTSRTITLAFKIPAGSEGEAYENLGRVQLLTQFLYPAYSSTSRPDAQLISQGPLVRMSVMNLVQKQEGTMDEPGAMWNQMGKEQHLTREDLYQSYKAHAGPENGLLGAITSCTVVHNIERSDSGVFEKGGPISKNSAIRDDPAPGTILPKLIDVNLSFNAIHETTIGWKSDGTSMSPSFPYGVTLKEPSKVEQGQKFNQRVAAIQKDERDRNLSQAMIDNAKARYADTLFTNGQKRYERDLKKLAKGKGSEYIAGAVAGQQAIAAGYEEGGIDSEESAKMHAAADAAYTGGD